MPSDQCFSNPYYDDNNQTCESFRVSIHLVRVLLFLPNFHILQPENKFNQLLSTLVSKKKKKVLIKGIYFIPDSAQDHILQSLEESNIHTKCDV